MGLQIIAKCPSCNRKGFVICENCRRQDRWAGITSDHRAIVCTCGRYNSGARCTCGTTIYTQFYSKYTIWDKLFNSDQSSTDSKSDTKQNTDHTQKSTGIRSDKISKKDQLPNNQQDNATLDKEKEFYSKLSKKITDKEVRNVDWVISMILMACAYLFSSYFALLTGLMINPLFQSVTFKYSKKQFKVDEWMGLTALVILVWVFMAIVGLFGSDSVRSRQPANTPSNSSNIIEVND